MTALPTKIIAALLAALLGASGGAASFAACPYATGEALARTASHDCCPSQRARADSRDAGSHHAHGAPAHHDHQNDPDHSQRASQRAGCAAHRACDSARIGSRNDSGSPCADCCAPLLAGASSPAVASPRNANRADDAHDATAPQPLAPAPPRRRDLAPTKHAPPAPRARLHALNSVLLI
ncbi:MAG: hypothetical protein LC785_06325 [Acidobacteria bacterium]|nr:hypothetical protein [Acidobacteriota bacterium]MCA1641560.1 hypothetical protein [Acidobacteriota bacterium]